MAKLNEFFYYSLITTTKPFFSFPLNYKINVVGKENLPKGRAILVSNHSSNLDAPFEIIGLQKRIYHLSKHFIGNQGYSHFSFSKVFMESMGHILLENEELKSRHLKKIYCLLEQEKYFGIFPEGTRSEDGKISNLYPGLAKISYYSKAPIVPVIIKGTYEIWPKSQKLPKLHGNVVITVGKQIPAPKTKSEIPNLMEIVKLEMERLFEGEN